MGSAFKFLHAADVHLDSPLRGLERYEEAPADRIRGATRRAFEGLARLAIDEAVAFVVLAGDLYDGDWKDYNTGLFLTRVLRELREAGIRVYLLAGNHDAASRITRSLRLPEGVHAFATDRPETFEIPELGVALHGQGFAQRVEERNLARDYPEGRPDRFDVGVLHTSLDGRPGHDPYAPCSVEDLRSRGYDYWALGHVHQREVVSEEPWIVFPGNLQGRHVREAGPKGATLVTVRDHAVEELAFRPLDVVRWDTESVRLAEDATPEQALDRVRSAFEARLADSDSRMLALRLDLRGRTAAHGALHRGRDAFVNECRSLAVDLGGGDLWLEKVVIGTEALADPRDAMERDDALGGLLRAIDRLEGDGPFAEALEEVWDVLGRKLAGVGISSDDLDPHDPAERDALLEDVKALLLSRLAGEEAAP